MNEPTHHTQHDQVTALIHEVARLNGQLVMAGDRLMRGFGLSSARWKVIGAVRASGRPQTVAWIARTIGLKRQGVQRIANELEAEGFVRLIDNPDHKRARLLELSPAGAAAFSAVTAEYEIWANKLLKAVPEGQLQTLLEQIRGMRELLGAHETGGGGKTVVSAAPHAQDMAPPESKPAHGQPVKTPVRLPEIAPWP